MTRAWKRPGWALLILAATVAYGQFDPGGAAPRVSPDSTGVIADTADTGRAAVRAALQDEELKVVRRKYKYRRQVALAVFMMAFVAIAMTTADALNPE